MSNIHHLESAIGEGIADRSHKEDMAKMSQTMPMDSPPAGIDPSHVRPTKGPRRNSCEHHPGLIQSTHIAPLNEGLMYDDAPPAGIDPTHVRHNNGPMMRRNSCEAKPGLIQSTHLAPLNECLVTKDRESPLQQYKMHHQHCVHHHHQPDQGRFGHEYEDEHPLDPDSALLRLHLLR